MTALFRLDSVQVGFSGPSSEQGLTSPGSKSAQRPGRIGAKTHRHARSPRIHFDRLGDNGFAALCASHVHAVPGVNHSEFHPLAAEDNVALGGHVDIHEIAFDECRHLPVDQIDPENDSVELRASILGGVRSRHDGCSSGFAVPGIGLPSQPAYQSIAEAVATGWPAHRPCPHRCRTPCDESVRRRDFAVKH